MPESGMRWLVSEFDYRDGYTEERNDVFGTAEILEAPRKEIQTGLARGLIGSLGGLHRQLLQESDYHAVGRSLLRKRDLEERAREGDWGQDWTEQDFAEVSSRVQDDPRALEWLQKHKDEYEEISPEDAIKLATFGLNDPDAPGYIPPRDKYTVVERFKPNMYKEAAERRIRQLSARLREISCLFTVGDIETHLFRIHPSYSHDKTILTQWTQEQKVLDRQLYASILRRRGCDEETIRRRIWFGFDRVARSYSTSEVRQDLQPEWWKHVESSGEVAPAGLRAGMYSEVITSSMATPPCLWDIERSKAFCDLYHTKLQWNKIYEAIWTRLGAAILCLARNAKDESSKQNVRRLLGKWDRLPQSVVKKIADVLSGEEN